MLNHQGGHVLFGVAPDGDVVGQEIGKGTLEDVSRELQGIDPIVYPSITAVPLQGRLGVIIVRVDAGHQQPYAHNGIAYKRMGNTTVESKEDSRDRMAADRVGQGSAWDRQLVPDWTIDDLDLDLLQDVIKRSVHKGRVPGDRGSMPPEEALMGLELADRGVLRRAAVILFGKRDRLGGEFPQCHIRLARFLGIDRREFLDNRQFSGNAFTLFAQAKRFLHEWIPIASRIEPDQFVRVDTPLYPRPATREAVANAICRRDYAIDGGSVGVAIYDDRLEVTSPGKLPSGVTPEQLFVPHESVRRNPLIAKAFYSCGIIEQWGRGTLDMMEQSIRPAFRSWRSPRKECGSRCGSGTGRRLTLSGAASAFRRRRRRSSGCSRARTRRCR